MSDFLGIDVSGLPELQAQLAKLPDAVADAGVEEANDYILNIEREYQPYRHVTRKSVYGQSFKSDKQRRYFFAALRSGEIGVPYRRTQEMRKGWRTVGSGKNQIIVNEVPHAGYPMDDDNQNRLLAAMGWQPMMARINARMSRVLEKFEAGVKKAIRKLGLD